MTGPTRACPSCHTPLPDQAQFCQQCGTATRPEAAGPPPASEARERDLAKVRGALADRYRIERVVGEGGMATVYLAEDLKHRRKVAVKVMRQEVTETLGSDRFLREIEIAAKLSHPNVLPVHDSGTADGLFYYVMPWVEGGSLHDCVQRQGALPVERALRLAREVADALDYAHRQGIVHRDVKPANILLSGGHALVADFGIARPQDQAGARTLTGVFVGTPEYMAPEQATGEGTVDARADVYALGTVLYELLAGRPAYSGETPLAVLARTLTGPPPSLELTRPGIPGPVVAVVARAMARDANARYQSAAALAEALDEAFEVGRTEDREALRPGPSMSLVVALFLAAAASVLAVSFALVREVGLPGWMFPLAVVLMTVGLVIIVATARLKSQWAAGASDRGLKRWFSWRNVVAGGVLAFAGWGALAAALVLRIPLVAGLGGTVRLAVLPFENIGPADNAYFAEGMADQVRGKLTALAGFQIIARPSSMKYHLTTSTPQEIGRDLGVPYLLTATVRVITAGDSTHVRVVPELIDARSGSATWQQTFDAPVTDVFEVQQAIASQVAEALGIVLGSRERLTLAQRPTGNLAAYDAFLRGEAILLSIAGADPAALRLGASFYEQAVVLDPSFGQAWARLAQVRSSLYFLSVPSNAEAEAAGRAVERARALAPRDPKTFLALSLYGQYVLRDLARAREAAEQGLAASPADVDLLVRLASFEAIDQPAEALRLQRRATELDPRSVPGWVGLGNTLVSLRRYREALQAIERGLRIDPTSLRLYQLRALAFLGQGDLAGARRSLATVPRDMDQSALVAYMATYNDLYWVLSAEQQALLLTLPPSAFDNDRATWGAVMMQTYGYRGDVVRARAYADSARLSYEAQLRDAPDDAQLHSLRGLALAYLGRGAEAVAEGRRGVDLVGPGPTSTYLKHQLARIYVRVGQPEPALEQLEALLRVPYYLSPGRLRIDPDFAALKGNPRFERMVAGG
jgi:TolB-like protein/tRNA A-37 threonylcarbamoyl transferase component Bud32